MTIRDLNRRFDWRLPSDEAATIAFGQALLDALPEDLAGWTILLNGELGAGKSTFFNRVIGRRVGCPGGIDAFGDSVIQNCTPI